MNSKSVVEIVGWLGVVLILLAYSLNSFGVVTSESVGYQSLNALGALGIIVSSGTKRDWQPTALNLIWLAVALIALLR